MVREFVYYSKSAVTAGNMIKENLMKAGRIDIACQIVIQAFFVSRHMRNNVKLHLIFDGAPDSPKHLEMFPGKNILGDIQDKIDISKKDVAGLFKKMLYKYKKGEKVEFVPGYSVEKKSFSKVLEELKDEGKEIYLLDKRGDDLRKTKIADNAVFVIGDHEGIPKQELKKIKHLDIKKISVGPYMLFASQAMTLLHNEMDRQEVESKV
tara:strand:+ start:2862 stop:3485 length:624 start_codon:yes stop_codon:yes gene_type:complete